MSSFLLKIVAIFTMTLDHAGFILFNNNFILRALGRIAMPIFAFQIGLGFKKTRSKLKYIFRLFLTALISQIPYSLMLRAGNVSSFSLNICFTFTFALLALYFIDLGKTNKIFYPVSLFLILLSGFIPMDYDIYAVLLVLMFYFYHEKKLIYTLGMALIAISYYFTQNNFIQLYMLLALPFFYLFNGKKGKNLKYVFYVFYPLHMLIISLIHYFINV